MVRQTFKINLILFYSLILLKIKIILKKGKFVDVSQFVQSKCLSYLFVSLSSKCDSLRAIAYASIFRFNSHLDSKFLIIYCFPILYMHITYSVNFHFKYFVSV